MDQETLERRAGCYDRWWDCSKCGAWDSVPDEGDKAGICIKCKQDHGPDYEYYYEEE